MASLTSLSKRLSEDYACANTEFSDVKRQEWITAAILEHNAGYDVTGGNLPTKEEQLVLLLAAITLCEARAAKAAQDNDLRSATGYGQDRNSPYWKNIDLAKKLRGIYESKCAAMGVAGATDDANTVMVGILTKVDSMIDARTPYTFDTTPLRTLVLSRIAVTTTTIKLRWTKVTDPTWVGSYLFYRANGAVLDETNTESQIIDIPGISDSAFLLKNFINPDTKALEVTGLTTGTPYHFVIATKNAQGKYTLSNELVVNTS